jgi:YD repeat-containing protein
VAFTYNADLLVSAETIFPATGGSENVNMTYDKDGLMTQAGVMKLRYNPTNGLLAADTVGGVITSYTYNPLGELASKEVTYGTTSLYKIEFVRDSLGRITQKRESSRESAGSSTQKTVVWSYRYDAVGRLSEVKLGDTLTTTYSYDANGNRLSKVTPAGAESGAYDDQDRMLSYGDARYLYSEFGDLKFKIVGTDTTRYTYDAFGSLVSVRLPDGTLIEYLLDGNGLRVGRKLNGLITHKWLYSNNLRIAAELDAANAITSRFVYTTSENVPEYMVRGGAIYRLITDHLGSVRRVVNTQTGAIVQEMEYDEFGNVLSDSNPGFAGELHDAQTGLVRFGVRDYDANIGRWLGKDPILFVRG